MTKELWPKCTTNCADCGIGTITLGEWYMVHDDVWEQAWAGRRKPWHCLDGQEVLCIGCLEQRLGRALVASDFTDAPINDPDDDDFRSNRLYERLTADGPDNVVQMPRRVQTKHGDQMITMGWEDVLTFFSERLIGNLPEDKRAALRASFREQVLHAPADDK